MLPDADYELNDELNIDIFADLMGLLEYWEVHLPSCETLDTQLYS